MPQLFETLVSHAPLEFLVLYHDNTPAYRVFTTQEFLKAMEVEDFENQACTTKIIGQPIRGLSGKYRAYFYIRAGVILHHRAGGILQSNPHLIE